MKKFTFLFSAAVIALSCSDDDNAPVSLDGTWKLTYVKTNSEAEDLNGDGITSENLMDETDCMDNTNIVFTSGSTATFGLTCISEATEAEHVTYTSTGNTVEFIYAVQDVDPGFNKKTKYTRSGNTLTATFIGNSTDYVPEKENTLMFLITAGQHSPTPNNNNLTLPTRAFFSIYK